MKKDYANSSWEQDKNYSSIYSLEINGGSCLTFKLSVEITTTTVWCVIYVNDKEVWNEKFEMLPIKMANDFEKNMGKAKQYCGEELERIIDRIACEMSEMKQ